LISINISIFFIILLSSTENDVCIEHNQSDENFCNHTSKNLKLKRKNSCVEKKSKVFDSTKTKYLVFECKKPICGGWADRLKGIMSSFVWSLITNRTFLIVMSHPCDLKNMLEINEIHWNNTVECLDELEIEYLNKVSNSEFHKLLRYQDIKEYKSSADVIIIHNNLDWIQSFSFNINLYQDIIRLGYTIDKFKLPYLFRDFYKKLFKLTPKLMNKYREFEKRAKPNNKTKLYCAQIRIGGKRPYVEFDKMFTERNNSRLYWQFMKNNFLTNQSTKDYKIFITTDTQSVEEEAIVEFGADYVVHNSGLITHFDREKIISKNNCERVERAILDFHSLQLCDEVVISKSGFGILGILNRQDPIKNLYRFEKINNNYVFRKIDDYNILNE
jgi:hypothetical protein